MIDTRSLVALGVESMETHRLRTALTMLGVVFGVAAVVSMLSIGEGAKREALEQIAILGVNNVIVKAKLPTATGDAAEETFHRSPALTVADGHNLGAYEDLFANVVPMRFEGYATVQHGSAESPARIVATLPTYLLSSNVEVERGRFLSESDLAEFRQVCTLGAKVKRALFAFEDPLGQLVRIGDLEFTVIGVMADKYIGRGKVEGLELTNLNEDVYIPFTTAAKKIERSPSGAQGARFMRGMFSVSQDEQIPYNLPEIDQLTLTVRDLSLVPLAAHIVRRVLERRHGGVDDFEIVVPESLLRHSQRTQRIFNIVMGAIAGLSLVVGGIGIMNIMLATVLERTREIGVRRAVGATRGDILRQFLLEAVAICLVGCGVGILLGLFFSKAISLYAHWPTVVSPFSIVLAVGVSTLVGLVFGVYPARQAARLNVIEALRYE